MALKLLRNKNSNEVVALDSVTDAAELAAKTGAHWIGTPADVAAKRIAEPAEWIDITALMGSGGPALAHLGDAGFAPLNGVIDAGYGNVPTILTRTGYIAAIVGVLTVPAEFAGGNLEVCELPDASWDENGWGFGQAGHNDSVFNLDDPAHDLGVAWVKGAAWGRTPPRIEVQGLPAGQQDVVLKMWWVTKT